MHPQGRSKLFYGGGLSKNIGHHGFPTTKNVRVTPAKTPKNSPKKQYLGEKINYLKPHIWSLSFDYTFSSRKCQGQQKLAKMITHFTIPFRSKNRFAYLFYEHQLTQHYKKYTFSTQSQIPSLYKFSRKHISGWCPKKSLHCSISRRPRTAFSKHRESKCLYIPVHLR